MDHRCVQAGVITIVFLLTYISYVLTVLWMYERGKYSKRVEESEYDYSEMLGEQP